MTTKIKPARGLEANLPAASLANLWELAYTTDTGKLLISDGSSWVQINSGGGGGGYTQEQIEDIVANLIEDTSTITKTYNDVGNKLQLNTVSAGGNNVTPIDFSIDTTRFKAQNQFNTIATYGDRIGFTGSGTNVLAPATCEFLKAGNAVQIGLSTLSFKVIDIDPTLEMGFNFAGTGTTTLPVGFPALGTAITTKTAADNEDGTRATVAFKFGANNCKVITTDNARDWVAPTFTPAINSAWTYAPYVYYHKCATGDVWLVMQPTGGSAADVWYSSDGLNYNRIYQNFPIGSVTNSAMMWYEPTEDMLIYSYSSRLLASPSVLAKRTAGVWATHTMPNRATFMSSIRTVGYNTELSRYEALMMDSNNNGQGYVFELNWSALWGYSGSTWWQNPALNICQCNSVYSNTEPSYGERWGRYLHNMFIVPGALIATALTVFKCSDENATGRTHYTSMWLLNRDVQSNVVNITRTKNGQTHDFLMTFTNAAVSYVAVLRAVNNANYYIDNRLVESTQSNVLVILPAVTANGDNVKAQTVGSIGSDSVISVIANGNGKVFGWVNGNNRMIDWRIVSIDATNQQFNRIECAGFVGDNTTTDITCNRNMWSIG